VKSDYTKEVKITDMKKISVSSNLFVRPLRHVVNTKSTTALTDTFKGKRKLNS